MRIIPKIKINKARRYIKRIPRILAENSFIVILILFLISLFLGFLVFYRYILFIEQPKFSNQKKFQIEKEAYQRIMSKISDREKKFNEADSRNYPDPFKLTK